MPPHVAHTQARCTPQADPAPDGRCIRLLSELWSIRHSVKTIQLVLEAELLRAANGAAKRARVNRSAFIRQPLREHLRRAGMREAEARDRRGYLEHPEDTAEVEGWERAASWPVR